MPAQVNVASFSADAAAVSIAAPATSHTAGNLLVVCVGWEDFANLSSVTDTAGNKYELGVQRGTTQPLTCLAFCENILGNAANIVTATFSAATAEFRRIIVVQYSGMWVEPATLDYEIGDATLTPGVDHIAGNLITANASDLLVVATKGYASGTFTPFTDWTEIVEVGGTFAASERIVTATGTYSARQTFSISNSWAAAAMALKGSLAAPSTRLYQRMTPTIRMD